MDTAVSPSIVFPLARLLWIEPWHHGAQVLANGFDLVCLVHFAVSVERRPTGHILQYPLTCKFAVLNFAQDFSH